MRYNEGSRDCRVQEEQEEEATGMSSGAESWIALPQSSWAF